MASPKGLFLVISHQAPKQSFCFKLLALICPPADPVRKKEAKSSPLGGMWVFARCFFFAQTLCKAGRAQGINPEPSEVGITSDGSSFHGEDCASRAPSDSSPMEKYHL